MTETWYEICCTYKWNKKVSIQFYLIDCLSILKIAKRISQEVVAFRLYINPSFKADHKAKWTRNSILNCLFDTKQKKKSTGYIYNLLYILMLSNAFKFYYAFSCSIVKKYTTVRKTVYCLKETFEIFQQNSI